MLPSDSPVHRYHDGTKHHYHQFARSLGYLDWSSQPSLFRRFRGSRVVPLYPSPDASSDGYVPARVSYGDLFTGGFVPADVSLPAVGDLLRHALGLSAWKSIGTARWPLRVNPSSGNLHPTEAYLVSGPLRGLSPTGGVYHYAADAHAVEQRCAFDGEALAGYLGHRPAVLVALTSIHWRESWKYGERAFRYCQHDLGHAIAALSLSAAALGWQTRLLSQWSHATLAAVTGVDRDEDFVEAEREEPCCVLSIGPSSDGMWWQRTEEASPEVLADAVRAGQWSGAASQLSQDHVQWTFIDDIAEATRVVTPPAGVNSPADRNAPGAGPLESTHAPLPPIDARSLFLRRRSAVALDGVATLPRDTFLRMLSRVATTNARALDVLWWEPCVHLALFVHRVDTLEPGLYFLGRSPGATDRFLDATTYEFGREAVSDDPPLVLLARGDCRAFARRLSCDQDIAADGCFSLAMLAEFDGALHRWGAPFYRQLYWECGFVGQLLYLEAEAAGMRATGIGCFYDDGVHEGIGLEGHVFQSLYHFTVGGAVEDGRLGAEPGYPWELGK